MSKAFLTRFITEVLQHELTKITEPKRSGLSLDQLGLKPQGGVENIIKVYNQATPEEKEYWGKWYHNAKSDVENLAKHQNLPFPVVAAIVAVLSPGNRWTSNLTAAVRLITGASKVNSYPRQILRAKKILETGDTSLVSGPKVTVFFNSLMNPKMVEKDMVLDGHAINIWRGEKVKLKGLSTPVGKERSEMIKDYHAAAEQLGVPVQAVQAVTWYVWKHTGKTPPLEAPTGVYDVSKFRNAQPANDVSLTESKLTSAIAKLQKTGNQELADRLLSSFSSIQPKFVDWLIRVLPNQSQSQDQALRSALESFEQAVKTNQIPEKDINKYPDAVSLVAALQKVQQSATQTKQSIKKTGANIVYKDQRFTVIEPLTPEGCQLYGKGTKWCISSKDLVKADYYKNTVFKHQRFLFVVDKTPDEQNPGANKIALAWDSVGIWATLANDEPIPLASLPYVWSDNHLIRELNRIIGKDLIPLDPDQEENSLDEVNAIGAGGIVGAGMGNGGTDASKKLMWSGNEPLKENTSFFEKQLVSEIVENVLKKIAR